MKLYTINYDCNRPSPQQVNIPTNSDCMVGFNIKNNGKTSKISPDEIVVKTQAGDTLSCENETLKEMPVLAISTGGEAKMEQLRVEIDHGYDFNDQITTKGGPAEGSTAIYFPDTPEYDLSAFGIEGLAVDPRDVEFGGERNLSAMPTDDTSITSWFYVQGVGYARAFAYKVGPNGTADQGAYGKLYIAYLNSQGWAQNGYPNHEDGPAWVVQDGAGHALAGPFDNNWPIPSGYRLATPGLKSQSGKYYVVGWKLKAGTPYSAKFKLTKNVYASQTGDVGKVTSGQNSTINLAGEFANGEEFSYDVVVA